MATVPISVDRDRIAEFCQKWDISEMSLFGSVLRNDFGPESDIDVLVRFGDDSHWSLFHVVEMRDELATIFGREVDLVEEKGLQNPFRRHEILKAKQILYAR